VPEERRPTVPGVYGRGKGDVPIDTAEPLPRSWWPAWRKPHATACRPLCKRPKRLGPGGLATGDVSCWGPGDERHHFDLGQLVSVAPEILFMPGWGLRKVRTQRTRLERRLLALVPDKDELHSVRSKPHPPRHLVVAAEPSIAHGARPSLLKPPHYAQLPPRAPRPSVPGNAGGVRLVIARDPFPCGSKPRHLIHGGLAVAFGCQPGSATR